MVFFFLLSPIEGEHWVVWPGIGVGSYCLWAGVFWRRIGLQGAFLFVGGFN